MAITASQRNLKRALIPPCFLPPSRLMRSSIAPRTATAISTPTGKSMDRRPWMLKTRVITTTDSETIKPPIVGVPVLMM
jgi:hypothetical protein